MMQSCMWYHVLPFMEEIRRKAIARSMGPMFFKLRFRYQLQQDWYQEYNHLNG